MALETRIRDIRAKSLFWSACHLGDRVAKLQVGVYIDMVLRVRFTKPWPSVEPKVSRPMGILTTADIKDLGPCWAKGVDLRHPGLVVAAIAGLLTEQQVDPAPLKEDSTEVDMDILRQPKKGTSVIVQTLTLALSARGWMRSWCRRERPRVSLNLTNLITRGASLWAHMGSWPAGVTLNRGKLTLKLSGACLQVLSRPSPARPTHGAASSKQRPTVTKQLRRKGQLPLSLLLLPHDPRHTFLHGPLVTLSLGW